MPKKGAVTGLGGGGGWQRTGGLGAGGARGGSNQGEKGREGEGERSQAGPGLVSEQAAGAGLSSPQGLDSRGSQRPPSPAPGWPSESLLRKPC